jgi:hypothetical protein
MTTVFIKNKKLLATPISLLSSLQTNNKQENYEVREPRPSGQTLIRLVMANTRGSLM